MTMGNFFVLFVFVVVVVLRGGWVGCFLFLFLDRFIVPCGKFGSPYPDEAATAAARAALPGISHINPGPVSDSNCRYRCVVLYHHAR